MPAGKAFWVDGGKESTPGDSPAAFTEPPHTFPGGGGSRGAALMMFLGKNSLCCCLCPGADCRGLWLKDPLELQCNM